MKIATKRAVTAASALLLLAGTLTACSTTDNGSGGDGAGDSSKKIALLLPESKTTRYEAYDRPLFEAKVKELCADCEVIYSNADQDAAKQQQQAESALTQGIAVMVLDPVDSSAAASIVNSAKAQDVPVISYDRLINSSDLSFYLSFDNEKVGELQGQAFVDKLAADGNASGDIVMINGSPTDNNATLFKKGAHNIIDASDYKVVAEFDTPDWSPDKAQEWMAGQVTQFGDKLVGVYAANDGTAGGAIAAMKAAGVTPLPPVTGQDAELPAIQRIVAGDQFMTIYKALKLEAETAAQLAVDVVNGTALKGESADTNGVPTTLLNPVVVTLDNIMDTVVKDGFYKVSDICTADYAAACTAAGIK
ncbi:D-xylose transport system substrate-binding protein [Homoserinimonas aerilata]|uniref:D-xylose transport system substrate-binding protein n=1 Tax=Homoserinimonas aerilata TaxID=1162970 RepID=A0A542XX25_9MICO|nr:sugar ABC transporter substrate-binding protein [Homoserinimonas aerilata]TQL40380.1 D-xylose transport system substrate-binding protein [Homoserinimonas aerilata]